MEYKFEISDTALNELNLIIEYIGLELKNPTVATNQSIVFSHSLNFLRQDPDIYRIYYRFQGIDYRRVNANNYAIIFWINEKNKSVNVVHFFMENKI
jgi:plasmid stabilization system protein ParE